MVGVWTKIRTRILKREPDAYPFGKKAEGKLIGNATEETPSWQAAPHTGTLEGLSHL